MSLKKSFSKGKATCKVTFSLPKEAVNGGTKVLIVGDFNDWNPSKGVKMKAGKKSFSATIELKTGREYEFRYLIDKFNWTNDWEADAYRPSPYYGVDNSVLILPTPVNAIVLKPKAKAEKKKASKPKATKAKVVKKKAAPKKKATAKADDLTKIEGVGPKIAGLLKKDGFKTFAELSKAKKSALTSILDAAGSRYRMHDPSTWAKQAKLAAAGKWEQLDKLQGELKGGRK